MESAPNFGAKEILAAIARGEFRVMSGYYFDAFAGAAAGSMICEDMQGYTVVVGTENFETIAHKDGNDWYWSDNEWVSF